MKIVHLRDKIPKLLVLPLIILLIYSVYSGLSKLEEKQELNRAGKYMQFSIVSSGLIHELQKERGYSSAFISSKARVFSNEVKQQRQKTDKEIKNLTTFVDKFDYYESKLHFKQFTNVFLSSIDTYRTDIDKHKYSASEIMNYYTNHINILLSLNEQIISINRTESLTLLVQSYITLMKAKEKAGIERALISRVLGGDKLSADSFHEFEVLISAQDVYIAYFKSTALKEHVDMLTLKMATDSFVEVNKIRNKIYTRDIKNEIVSRIRELLGYGGFIHNFKNYQIHKTKDYAIDVKKQYAQLLIAINDYKAIDYITVQETEQLEIIKNTLTLYIQNLQKTTAASSKTIEVNDKLTIEVLNKLANNMYVSPSIWFKNSTDRINLLKEVEDKVANDLQVMINNHSGYISKELIIQAVILIIILIIILLSLIMLRELTESGRVLRRAQENTRSGSYEYYLEDNIIIWSDEHYKLLQVDKNKFKPSMETFMIFVHPDDVEIVRSGFESAKSSKGMVFFEYRILLFDNTKMYVRSSAEVIKYSIKGDPLIIVGTITDITQSKKLEQEIVDTQKDVILTMGTIGETRSMETGYHVKRVAEYSKLLYLLSGAKEDEAELLKMASPMHDIGKVGIPDHILNKPGKLTPGEWAIMQTHSEMGYDMFKNSNREILKLAATISLTHHEKYDGSGYPRGLESEEIPIVGRITALADVFDALGSDRCYKLAWKLEDILQFIKEESGKHFDPELVSLFLKHIKMFIHIRDEYKETDTQKNLDLNNFSLL